MGIYSIKKMAAAKAKGKEKGVGVGIRASYLRVVGIQMDTEGAGEEEHLHQSAGASVMHVILTHTVSVSWQGAAPLAQFLLRRRRSSERWPALPTSMSLWLAPWPPPSTAATT